MASSSSAPQKTQPPWVAFPLKRKLHEIRTTIEDALKRTHDHDTPHRHSVCNKQWKRGHIAYRCLECELDPTSAICAECFHAGGHTGHAYCIVQSGGCCDCGDPLAFCRVGFCPAHGAKLGPDGSPRYLPSLTIEVQSAIAASLDLVAGRLLVDAEDALRDEGAGKLDSASMRDVDRQLLHGVKSGLLHMVEAALSAGASPDVVDVGHFGRPRALHWAAQQNIAAQPVIVSRLLKAGADPNSLNAYRQTPLQVAAFEGHSRVAALLLDARADPHHTDIIFGSAINIARHEAARHGARLVNLMETALELYPAPDAAAARSESPPTLDASIEVPMREGGSPIALEMCRHILQWLLSLGELGDSVREEIARAIERQPNLLGALLRLRVACDEPFELPSGVAACRPLTEFDDLCHALLLFSWFKERLLADMLNNYPRFLGLGDAVAPTAAASSVAAADSPPQPLRGVGVFCAGDLATFGHVERSTRAAIEHGHAPLWEESAQSGTPMMRTRQMQQVGKASFLEVFSLRLFTGYERAPPTIRKMAVPKILDALAAILALSLRPAGTLDRQAPNISNCDEAPLPPTLISVDTVEANHRTIDAHFAHDIAQLADHRTIDAHFAHEWFVHVWLAFELDKSPSFMQFKSQLEAAGVPADEAQELTSKLMKARSSGDEAPTSGEGGRGSNPSDRDVTPFDVMQRLLGISTPCAEGSSEGEDRVRTILERVDGVRTILERVDARTRRSFCEHLDAGRLDVLVQKSVYAMYRKLYEGETPPGGRAVAMITDLISPLLVKSDHVAHLLKSRGIVHPVGPFVVSEHPAVSNRRHAQVVADLHGVLKHESLARQLLEWGLSVEGGSRGGDGLLERFLDILSWVQHSAPLPARRRERGSLPRGDGANLDEDGQSLAWVHGFCLYVDLSSLFPLLLAPLRPTMKAGEESPQPAADARGSAARRRSGRFNGAYQAGGLGNLGSSALEAKERVALLKTCAQRVWSRLTQWLDTIDTSKSAVAATTSATSPTTSAALSPQWWVEESTRDGSHTGAGARSPLRRSSTRHDSALLPVWQSAGGRGSDSDGQVLCFQLPLHRLVAATIQTGLKHGLQPSELLPLNRAAAERVLEHPLRLQALPLQLHTGSWDGNGRAPWAAHYFYLGRYHREQGYRKDMLLMQACAVAMGADDFVWRYAARFNVMEQRGSADDERTAAPARDGKVELAYVLRTLLSLYKDWAADDEVQLRRVLVHQLALGPLPHSTLTRRLETHWPDHPKFDSTLREVGRRVATPAGFKYRLRTSLWGEVDPLHPFYTENDMKQVAQRLHALVDSHDAVRASGGEPPPPSPGLPHTPNRRGRGQTPAGGSQGAAATLPSHPPLSIVAGGFGVMPALRCIPASEAVFELLRRAICACADGLSDDEVLLPPLVVHLYVGIQLCLEHDAASDAYLSRLCDEGWLRGEEGGGSALHVLERLLRSSSMEMPLRRLLEKTLELASDAHAGCASALAKSRTAHAASPVADNTELQRADHHKRRQQARAGAARARMMQRMAAAQAAFATDELVDPAEAPAGVQRSPSVAARAERGAWERSYFARLLGDADAACVLCKEPLCGVADGGGESGLISRVCPQYRPSTGTERHRQKMVSSAMAGTSKVGGASVAPAPSSSAPTTFPAAADGDAVRAKSAAQAAVQVAPPRPRAENTPQPRSTSVQRQSLGKRHRSSEGGTSDVMYVSRLPDGTRVEARIQLPEGDRSATALLAAYSPTDGAVASVAAGGASSETTCVVCEPSEVAGGGTGPPDKSTPLDVLMGKAIEADNEAADEASQSPRAPRRRMIHGLLFPEGRPADMMLDREAEPDASLDTGDPETDEDGNVVSSAEDDGATDGETLHRMLADDADDSGLSSSDGDEEDDVPDEDLHVSFRSEAEQMLMAALHGEMDDDGPARAAVDPQLALLMAADEDSEFDIDSEEDSLDDMLEGSEADSQDRDPAAAVPPARQWPLPALNEQPTGVEECAQGPILEHMRAARQRDEALVALGLRPSSHGKSPSESELATAADPIAHTGPGLESGIRLEGGLLSRTNPGALMTTCGHAAHFRCWRDYMSGLYRRMSASEGFEGEGLVKPQKGEFICPLCRRPANALMPLLPPLKGDAPSDDAAAVGEGGGANEVVRVATWASAALDAADSIALPPELRPMGDDVDYFYSHTTYLLGAARRLSVSPSDARVRCAPAAILAHNAAVAESARGVGGETTSEEGLVRLRLRALFYLGRAAPRYASSTARTMLQLAHLGSGPDGAGASVGAHALAALLCSEPLNLFCELLLLHGLDGAEHAMLLAAATSVLQTLAGAATVGVLAAKSPAEEGPRKWAEMLDELASPVADHLELLSNHAAKLLRAGSHLMCVLRDDAAAAEPSMLARGGLGVADVFKALAGGGTRHLDARGAGSLLGHLTQRGVGELQRAAPQLWEWGAAAFAAASLPARDYPAGALDCASDGSSSGGVLPPGDVARLALQPAAAAAELGLISLPKSYEAFFHESSTLRCTQCNTVPDSRAMCLRCGECVCGIDTAHGPRAVISHAKECGAGACLFLLTNNSAVLLVRNKRFTLVPSPYRDEHGEADLGLLRGKPLTLVDDEYAAIQRQWLGLSFDEAARNEDNEWQWV